MKCSLFIQSINSFPNDLMYIMFSMLLKQDQLDKAKS